MREKKEYTVLTFRTTTEAMAMESTCNANAIPGRLIPVPREITAGCGLAWRMLRTDYAQYREDIENRKLVYEQAVELLL